ncbi:MAG TPA: TetR/AcrR family transcriptional regulator [Fulvivirga sp.]|nr:TetR/AcrR family transcriptional regulator [Fulvivirga sp.]
METLETLEIQIVSIVLQKIFGANMSIEGNIIAGAGELFHKYGIRSVSMDDIARHLSISKKTIYQYYKDKDEIVTLALKAHMDHEKLEYGEACKESANAIEELSRVSKCMRSDFKDMNPSLLFDMQKYHPNAWKLWMDFKNEYIKNHVVENLKRGIEEENFRKEIDPEAMAIFRVEQVQMAFDETIFPPDKFRLKELQLLLFDHFVHGIVTEKGKVLYEQYLKKEEINKIN